MAAELVLDSSVAVRAAGSRAAARVLRRYHLVGPPLLWSEVTSAVAEARWRRQVSHERARALAEGFEDLDVTRVRPAALYRAAADLAAELGWAKTYDAEFLALARIRGCRVVTADARLHRGAARTGLVLPLVDLR